MLDELPILGRARPTSKSMCTKYCADFSSIHLKKIQTMAANVNNLLGVVMKILGREPQVSMGHLVGDFFPGSLFRRCPSHRQELPLHRRHLSLTATPGIDIALFLSLDVSACGFSSFRELERRLLVHRSFHELS